MFQLQDPFWLKVGALIFWLAIGCLVLYALDSDNDEH